MVNHAMHGKNNMGMVRPGNISGNGVDKGRVKVSGIGIQANEPTL